jgi:hypothetical protein
VQYALAEGVQKDSTTNPHEKHERVGGPPERTATTGAFVWFVFFVVDGQDRLGPGVPPDEPD